MLAPFLSRHRQQEAVPVLTVHAILKGGRFVEAGTDLPKEEERRNGKAGKGGRSQPRRPRLQNGDNAMAPSNPVSYILSTSLIEVGVRGRSNHLKRVRQRARPHASRRPSLQLPLPPRRANLSRGKPGQFGCLLGPATSIPIEGHVTIRIDCVCMEAGLRLDYSDLA
jgi:hypothetical protein